MKIFNSLGAKLEEFTPIQDKKVAIYVCGITPYDTTHLGHAFTYIAFDVLVRYLRFLGYKVTYTQNVTDINDRDKDILEKARRQKISWRKLARFWTDKFLSDMEALNWVFPDHYLKASQQIPAMVDLIKKLLDNGLAYQANGSVYLDTQHPSYGKLSRLNRQQMLKKAKEFEEDPGNPDKKHPLDITLWRARTPQEPAHIPAFNSHLPKEVKPGRPGWHIECSTMSMATLGKQIDIHGGGADLIFPHHEAEIAQSEGATGKIPFAKYWLHTGTVFYQSQKMSKSKGNLVLVSDLLKKYSANSIRWLLLSHQWHKQWEYTEKDLIRAQKYVKGIEKTLKQNHQTKPCQNCKEEKEFKKIMNQNLNTPEALKLLLKLAQLHFPAAKHFYHTLGFCK